MDISVLLLVLVCISSALTESENDDWNMDTLTSRPPSAWNATWTDRLKKYLLTNYDKFARPAEHNNVTNVKAGLAIIHVAVNELESTMNVLAWLRLVWTDEKLKWNESDYGGLGVLHVASHEVWQPDILLKNSATTSIWEDYGNTNLLVYPNGEVLWVPPIELKVFCDLDLSLWPFDTQKCNFTLCSSLSLEHNINVTKYGGDDDLHIIETKNEWEIMEVKHYRNVRRVKWLAQTYPEVEMTITIRRRSPAYSAIIITPTTVIVLLTLASFWLPPTAGEKIVLNVCIVMIICIFLLYFSQKLPAMASHTPFMVLFYSSSLYLVSIATIVTVVVVNISRNQHVTQLPWIVRNLLTGRLGRVLGLGYIIAKATTVHHNTITGHTEEMREQQTSVLEDHEQMGSSSDDRHMISTRTRATVQYEWILLATAIDRVAFLVYCFLFAILAIVYAV